MNASDPDQGPDRDRREGEGSEVHVGRREEWDLLNEMGGPQGIADSSLPGLFFVVAYTVTSQDLGLSAAIAVGLAAAIALVRVVRGEAVRFAIAGFVGVALAAFIATRTGRAEDFFLPGLLFNAGYALAYLISVLVGWPLIGVILGPVAGMGMRWREDPRMVSIFKRISLLWSVMFLLRLAVQLPLYLSGSLVALGIAKTAMGLPLFLVFIWISWLILKANGIRLSGPGGDGEGDPDVLGQR